MIFVISKLTPLAPLTHCCWETRKRVVGKQKPQNAAFDQFANSLAIFLQEYVNLITGRT